MHIHLRFSLDAPRGSISRWFKYVITPLALVVAAGLGARAYDVGWIAPNQPVSAAALKADLDEIQARLNALESGLHVAPGSVTSDPGVTERVERATISGGSSPVIETQSGIWIASLVRASAGDMTLGFATGTFSARPSCFCAQTQGNTFRGCAITPIDANSVRVETFGTSTASRDTMADLGVQVLCIGPR